MLRCDHKIVTITKQDTGDISPNNESNELVQIQLPLFGFRSGKDHGLMRAQFLQHATY